MPVYQLGNGNDYFNSQNQPDWTNDSAVFGGNGNDTIVARALIPAYTSRMFIDGGNGDDSILLDAGNSIASGGNGNDTLTAEGGLGNTLIGGNGRDTLISNGGGSGMQPGNTLTGGLGRDTFILDSGTGNLVVTNDAAGNGVVSDGDTFKGPMDVITDYQRGEHIGLRRYDIATNGPTDADVPVVRVDTVALGPDPLPHTGDSFRPLVDNGQYAVFHGTFAGGNTFTVGADGLDLLAVYNTFAGPTDPGTVGRGSLVLQGVTDERLLDQALSPATTSGGGWDYASFNQGGSQSAAATAVLDPNGAAAVGIIPA